MDIIKNKVYWLLDSDGLGTTKVKVVALDSDERFCTVKYMDCCWNLKENILVARKGTKKLVAISRLQITESR